jgi:hypothetical protein
MTVGVLLGAAGTLPLAFLALDLLLSPGLWSTALLSPYLLVAAGVAVVGWVLVIWSDRKSRRRVPTRPSPERD